MTLIIENTGVLVRAGDSAFEAADIVIQKGKFVAIGPGSAAPYRGNADRIIPGEGLLAMPGLVNSHYHSTSSFIKAQLAFIMRGDL